MPTDLTLSDIQDAEYTAEQTRDLQNLSDTFYEDARTYKQSLDAERRRETAQNALRTLAEERHAKLRERVTLGVSVDTRSLTHEEQEVYAKLQNGGVDAETAVSLVVEHEEPEDKGNQIERLEVRLLQDIPDILGTDMHEYTNLGEEDVVALPRRNAETLVARDAAKPVYDEGDEQDGDEAESEAESDLLAESMGAD